MPLKGRERRGTDVVLNPFGVEFGGLGGDTKRPEKRHNRGVPAVAGGGQFIARLGQEDRAVGPRAHQAVAPQADERAVDRHVRHAQPPSEVHYARLTARGREVGDGLDVVLGRLRGVLAARPSQGLGLQGGGPDGGGRRAGGEFGHGKKYAVTYVA